MKALLLDNQVVDLANAEFEVHSSLSWVDCDDSVKVGYVFDGTSFSDPTPQKTPQEKLEELRLARNMKLFATDWWASSDLTMTAAQTAYRQALRDITETYTSLDDVVWPEVPNE